MKEYLFKTKAITRCFECPFRDGLFCLASDEKPINKYRGIKTRESFCPLKEVPTHGDLKDANKILQWLNRICDEGQSVSVGEIIDYIEKAPTIIEASEERE